ncbi:SDR family oxidoreductase [Nocardia sp. NPDC004722]
MSRRTPAAQYRRSVFTMASTGISAATPEQIAAPSLFLASEDASYITGIDMVVDGGWELSNFPNLAKLAG